MSDNSTDLAKMNYNSTVDGFLIDATDELINELENEELPAHIREARLNELALKSLENQFKRDNQQMSIYGEINEDQFLKLTTNNKKCIVHFFHPDFKRCDIINTHLQVKYFSTGLFMLLYSTSNSDRFKSKKLAVKYSSSNINFAKVNVDKAKFFVNKLKIQILPAIMCFNEGILCDKIIGFDEIGSTDNFPTEHLERRLRKKGVLPRQDNEENSDEDEDGKKKKPLFRRGNNYGDDSD